MYCSRCGKKVLDSMLYCPFCGAEIIIPEQEPYDGAAEPEPVKVEPVFSFELPEEPEPVKEAPKPETKLPWEEAEEVPEPEPEAPEPEAEEVEEAPEEAPEPEPEPVAVQKSKPAMDRRQANLGNVVPGHRSSDTRVPDKVSMFMDEEDDFDEDSDDFDGDSDDFDEFEERIEQQRQNSGFGRRRAERYQREQDEDDDEYDDDPEVPSFFMRHVRGIVGILLFVILLAILGFYALSDSGQTQLARINATLPLRPEIYSRIAYEHYQAAEYTLSGKYYERALAREPGNYNFASSAAMAYISGGDNDRAAEMLRKCVQIRPEAVEPYIYLLNLYPNANSRPWDVAQLLKQGYELTGDERLKDAANAFAQN